jgi:putative nucleotidyltransferase with HDIG domain
MSNKDLLALDLSTSPRGAHREACILVLERDQKSQITIQKMLDGHWLAVDVARTMEDVFASMTTKPHELLVAVFDAEINIESGLEFVKKMRTQHPYVPLVIVSSSRDTEAAVAAMRLGAADYLLRPLDAEQLVKAVERALTRRHAVQQQDEYQQSLVQVIASRTQMLKQTLEELEQACDFTLEALGDALDLRDSETEGHSRRVTAYSIALARAMGLSSQQVKLIARGAFLHDIGKMGIPDSILLKPGPLTHNERVEMHTHCERGYAVLKKIPFLSEAAEIVYAHQEHFDGSGYPRGLKGEEIHLGARIFSVADTLDAITSDRPYRNAQSFDQARKEIDGCTGTQFDPVVVETFRRIPNAFWEQIRADILANKFHLATLTR